MPLFVPCKDCDERKVGCHGECAKYKFYRVVNDALNKRELSDRRTKQACAAMARRARARGRFT